MIALVVELALLGSTYRSVASTADAAAEAGASMLSEVELYASRTVLDAGLATAEATNVVDSLSGGGAVATVTVASTRVCVTVHDQYRPRTLAFLGLRDMSIDVTSCAEPRTG
jgi:hypothetical protein